VYTASPSIFSTRLLAASFFFSFSSPSSPPAIRLLHVVTSSSLLELLIMVRNWGEEPENLIVDGFPCTAFCDSPFFCRFSLRYFLRAAFLGHLLLLAQTLSFLGWKSFPEFGFREYPFTDPSFPLPCPYPLGLRRLLTPPSPTAVKEFFFIPVRCDAPTQFITLPDSRAKRHCPPFRVVVLFLPAVYRPISFRLAHVLFCCSTASSRFVILFFSWFSC